MSELKQVILVRSDLKMSKGKVAAQVAHAAVDCALSANKKLVSKWRLEGMKKVTLSVSSEEELLKYFNLANSTDLTCSLICDAGRTQIAAGSKTCVGIGPGPSVKIDKITGDLKIY